MRSGQQKQRSRGRSSNGGGSNPNNNNNNNQRKGQNPLTRTYDSSGPDVKIRGTAQTIAEKYMALARDATSSGDRVMAENYLQHAEHYNRIIAAAQAMYQERYQRDDRNEPNDRNDYNDRQDQVDRDEDEQETIAQPMVAQIAPQPEVPQPVIDSSTPQPVIEGTPVEVQLEQETASGDAGEQGKASSRRRSSGRSRRPPRKSGDSAEASVSESAAPAEEPAE
ncbi:DUF4167 domain-containing protein [Rhizobium alvei]|uniref:DUF4167 domain-containing protein n=1 Tax=Rhizobium alvei TaxID=1132659 RepID=A0ABT8YM92_9HYPH|nr:DUF4167 domain-containing protein [Rhizobium alvei]MDO6964802.1 DUF4167 domain-containing protein [Rhizobium alvei]